MQVVQLTKLLRVQILYVTVAITTTLIQDCIISTQGTITPSGEDLSHLMIVRTLIPKLQMDLTSIAIAIMTP